MWFGYRGVPTVLVPMKPSKLTEFSVYLDQRPGELAGLLDAAASAGVDVLAAAVSESNGKVGPIVEGEVLAVPIEKRPNALRDLATAMADQRINLRYAYQIPRRGQEPARCVFRVDDLEDVVAKIEAIDWPGEG